MRPLLALWAESVTSVAFDATAVSGRVGRVDATAVSFVGRSPSAQQRCEKLGRLERQACISCPAALVAHF